MNCQECGESEHERSAEDLASLVPSANLSLGRLRYSRLLFDALSRIPGAAAPIRFETQIRLRKRGSLPGVVGLTTFTLKGYQSKGKRAGPSGQHTITFYTDLMSKLSNEAVTAVMAHELAHAWLNEHIRPEASKTREEDADMLAEMWGFGRELDALASETEPINA